MAEKKNREPKLTVKQRLFCEEFLTDCNATQAAIRAGYKPDNAKQTATENLAKPIIQEHLDKLIDERSKRILVTADSVLERLNIIANRCMQAEPVLDQDGCDTGEYQFNSTGANKSLELLGKHLGLFVERKEISGPNGGKIPMQTLFEFIPVNSDS